MKKFILYLLSAFLFQTVFGQYQGPVSKISSGYGADGSLTVKHIDITNDHNTVLKPISVFYPEGTSTPIPTIFYSHGYASTDTTYHIETLHHIASKGYAVVFVPYKTLGVTIAERYLTLYDGFVKAARENTSIIDTTRVGFYGQSFGGGATPRIAYRSFTENNWGENGKFIFCSAPWYSYELGTTNLSDYPTDCHMLTVFYDDDFTNDHRLGMDIFEHIAIDDSIKDCLTVYTDTVSGYVYQADHTLPAQYTTSSEFDAFDYYVTFRLIDALAEYTFTGNLSAKDVCLGNGSTAQLDMGSQLKKLQHTDSPIPAYAESVYKNPCSSSENERSSFCGLLTSISPQKKGIGISLAPNPTNGLLNITVLEDYDHLSITVFNVQGKKVYSAKNQVLIDLSTWPSGLYTIHIIINDHFYKYKQVTKN